MVTFNIHRKEFNCKIFKKVKKSDGTLEEMQENEVLFEKIDKDPVTIATASTTLTQATTHNITILNKRFLETE